MYRVYENKTSRPITFCITRMVEGWRVHKWYTVDSGEAVNMEYIENLMGPDSYKKSELFGLTLKKGSVQDVSKMEMPGGALANMVPPATIGKKKKHRR